MEEVLKFLEESNVYYLATMDNDKPRVRPFGTINIYDNHLYIQTSKKKDVFKQIEKNPNVELCAFKDGSWLRLSGNLVVDDRIEAKKSMLDKYPNLRGMYDEHDENTAVLYFDKGIAKISSFTSEDKVINI